MELIRGLIKYIEQPGRLDWVAVTQIPSHQAQCVQRSWFIQAPAGWSPSENITQRASAPVSSRQPQGVHARKQDTGGLLLDRKSSHYLSADLPWVNGLVQLLDQRSHHFLALSVPVKKQYHTACASLRQSLPISRIWHLQTRHLWVFSGTEFQTLACRRPPLGFRVGSTSGPKVA